MKVLDMKIGLGRPCTIPSFFYQPEIIAAPSFLLNEETSKHCIQVLRMKEGEQLQLTDGKGNGYKAFITKSDKRHCEVSVIETTFQPPQIRQVSIIT